MSQASTVSQKGDALQVICPSLENLAWQWSVFSEEKGLFFNGYLVKTPAGFVMIDPPQASEEVIRAIKTLLSPETPLIAILLTNKDHEREAQAFKRLFQAPVWIHQADAALLETPADQTFVDDERLFGALEVFQLAYQKSPGECVLYWPEQKTAFVGDAVIGKPAGSLSLLPAEKYPEPHRVKDGLKRLVEKLPPDLAYLLLGDGESLLERPYQTFISCLAVF